MRVLLPLAFALLAGPLPAAPLAREMREVRAGESIMIRPDKAYLLLRVPKTSGVPTFEPVLLRVPTDEEMARYEAARKVAFDRERPKLKAAWQKLTARKTAAEADGRKSNIAVPPEPALDNFSFSWDGVNNLQNVDSKRAFVKGETENIFLLEAPAGDYVVYGASWATGWAGVHVCFCLGSVRLTAQAGKVTDLGYFLADTAKSRSSIPELAAETGFGPSSDAGGNLLLAGTVRPPSSTSTIPPGISTAHIAKVRYRAVGKFFHPGAIGINRLVPVPGILAYDREKVIDVQSGQALPDNF